MMDFYSAYSQREEERKRQAKMLENARAMLVDKDFMDRLYLFMSDLSELPYGCGFDSLPFHQWLYFSEEEMKNLARYCCISDQHATPQQILHSLEQVFPRIRTEVNGVWHNKNERYINWIRNEKICIPGTLRGPQADEILQIHLEEEELERQREKEEQEKEDHTAELRKKAAQRRKETRERRKLEAEANNTEDSDESDLSHLSQPSLSPPPPMSLRQSARTKK
jgi:hypothetical protein